MGDAHIETDFLLAQWMDDEVWNFLGVERYERVNLKDTDNCVESEWRLRYMCESISTSEKVSTDRAVQVQERKQR